MLHQALPWISGQGNAHSETMDDVSLTKGPMGIAKRLILLSCIGGMCVGCDQVTKGYVKSELPEPLTLSYFGNAIRLQYEENSGGMLSFGANLSNASRYLLLTVLVGVSLFAFALFALFSHRLDLFHLVGFSLIVGGGFSNLLDRISNNGAVIDFLVIRVGDIQTAIFNFADVAILTGVVILLTSLYRKSETRFSKSKPS